MPECTRGFMRSCIHAVDAWLWRRNFHVPLIRRIALVQIVSVFVLLGFAGLSLYFTPWPLWFATGALMFGSIFYDMAHSVLRLNLAAYGMGLSGRMLLRMSFRLLCVGILLYVLLVLCNASALAIVGGFTTGMALALGTFAHRYFMGHKS